MIRNFLFILILILGAVIIDFQTILFVLFIYLSGTLITYLVTESKIFTIKIYQILFISSFLYLLMCYIYMDYHNYKYLLVFDSYNSFIPQTETYLESGSYLKALKEVWLKYTFLDGFQSGYFTYALLFAYLGKPFNLNFFVEQQISVLFIYSFVGVLLFKLLRLNGFNLKKSYKYTLLICIFSIIFFYSTLVLRDMHILFLYLLAIYYTFDNVFSFFTLIKIILVSLLCITFRVESGLFLILLIPIYLLLTLQNNRQRNIVIYVFLFILTGLLYFLIAYYNQISSVFEANQEVYVEGITEGNGIIASLQRVPIAGDFASVLYNAIQPIPFWSRFTTGIINDDLYSGEIYNIMNFPRLFSSYFNWFVIIYIFFWLFSKKLRREISVYISKPLKYQLLVGLFFLFLQSAVVAQRRIMAYYCIFYILFFIIYNNMPNYNKKNINLFILISYFAINIISNFLI